MNPRKLILLPNEVSDKRLLSTLPLMLELNRVGDEMCRANGCLTFCVTFGCKDVTRVTFSLSFFLLRIGKSKSLSLHSSMGNARSDQRRDPKKPPEARGL